MPLPRFNRLDPITQRHILEVAKIHFAQNGFTNTSYNSLILDTGISKTSFYLYFDGKEDLYQEVLKTIRQRLFEVLGDWVQVKSKKEFWSNLAKKSKELATHLQQNPLDLQLAQPALFEAESEDAKRWILDLIKNGQEIGIIRSDLDLELIFLATISVFQAIDKWSLKILNSGKNFSHEAAWSLLKGLWQPIHRKD